MTRAILTLIFTLTFVASPLLTDPFSGFRADQLPVPQINPPVQPAGYAFAIWGLIYAWLVVSAVFGALKRATDPAWDVMRGPLIISLAIGTPWLWIANQSAIWATISIFAMAIPAIMATLQAPTHDKWLAQVPVSIYAGWLTAASFVSLGSTAAGYGVLFDQFGWAIAGIITALIVASTIIWALVGILVANGPGTVGALAIGGIFGMALILMRQWRAA